MHVHLSTPKAIIQDKMVLANLRFYEKYGGAEEQYWFKFINLYVVLCMKGAMAV